MKADTKAVLDQIDALLGRAGLAPGVALTYDQADAAFSDSRRAQLATSWMEGIARLAMPGSRYVTNVRDVIEINRRIDLPSTLVDLSGILNALRDDYAAGYLAGIEELIHADLFADFLEMADELLRKNFKDAAAVITGSVLEEHLRKLAAKNGVQTLDGARPKKADTLNADLVKAGVYNKLEQKQVTAWLGLRNDAAHGKYGEYDATQVKQMLDGVRSFLIRHPA